MPEWVRSPVLFPSPTTAPRPRHLIKPLRLSPITISIRLCRRSPEHRQPDPLGQQAPALKPKRLRHLRPNRTRRSRLALSPIRAALDHALYRLLHHTRRRTRPSTTPTPPPKGKRLPPNA